MIELVTGDITEQDVDAIVNAANATLLGGGGVDGAIHRAGGPSILAECRRLDGCATGDVKATGAGNLAARHVLHAVGPVWRGGESAEAELLASCHTRAIELAARVAIGATRDALAAHPEVETARFVFRDEGTLAPYRAALAS